MKTATLTLYRIDDAQFAVRLLDEKQHAYFTSQPIQRTELQPLLAITQKNYRTQAPDLKQQGLDLFNWFNTQTQGHLAKLRQPPQALALRIDVELGINDLGLRHLPWELLNDGHAFWCADEIHLFTPLRIASAHQHEWQPAQRQLQLLFMASSPINLTPSLDFEAEEASILSATEKKPLVLQVEESGSLHGLEERLTEMEQAPDVIHISGHAEFPANSEPVFLLENDEGQLQKTNAHDLAKVLVATDRFPRLVFLSGCETGKSDLSREMLSFAENLVQAQVPVVLGWALPVGDFAASQTAAILYNRLATGLGIAESIAAARQYLLAKNSPYWHLLRCFTDHSELRPLVAKGKIRFIPPMVTEQAFLDAGNMIAVCKRTEFVGRRRLLQRSLRHLRAWYGNEAYAEGLLLYGMGGLGKSSTAARLLDRLTTTHFKVVHYGRLDETSLLTSLGRALKPEVYRLLNDQDKTLYERLHSLFTIENNLYCNKPLLIVLDDFEQNIPKSEREQGKIDGVHAYEVQSLQILHTVLEAIHYTKSDVRVIITCRHDIPIAAPYQLHKESLNSLRDADLNKKVQRLVGLQTASLEHKTQALQLADGNPRLLEQLNQVFLDKTIPVDELFKQLHSTAQSFREKILLQALLDAQVPSVRQVIALTALYRLPVPLAVVQTLNEDVQTLAYLVQGVKIGLVELNHEQGQAHYFVSNLLEHVLASELIKSERAFLPTKAAQILNEFWGESGSEAQRLEVVRLAIAGKLSTVAVEVGHRLAFTMRDQYRWHEAALLCQQILSLDEDFRILTTLAQVQQYLGSGAAAKLAIERAIVIATSVENLTDALRRERTLSFGAYADILQARGQLDEALRIRQQEELPVYQQLGEVREIAITKGQIADILQARGQLDEALYIYQNEVLTVFLDLREIGTTAVIYGRIAQIAEHKGELENALEIRQGRCLPVYQQLDDIYNLLFEQVYIALLLWRINAQQYQAQIQTLLATALTHAEHLQIPETEQIQALIQQLKLNPSS
ncbi:CHAT domain-containing protein [Thiothrix eikelboomii]